MRSTRTSQVTGFSALFERFPATLTIIIVLVMIVGALQGAYQALFRRDDRPTS